MEWTIENLKEWASSPHNEVVFSEPEYVGRVPIRRDLECTPAKQEFDDKGNCTHTAKGWKIVESEDGRKFPIRCCQHCEKDWPEELKEQLEQEKIEGKEW